MIGSLPPRKMFSEYIAYNNELISFFIHTLDGNLDIRLYVSLVCVLGYGSKTIK